MSLSLDFRVVVWRTEEEANAAFGILLLYLGFSSSLSHFNPSLCRFSQERIILPWFLIISSALCRCLQNKHLAIAMKRFVFLIIFLVYYLSFLQQNKRFAQSFFSSSNNIFTWLTPWLTLFVSGPSIGCQFSSIFPLNYVKVKISRSIKAYS